MTTRTLWFLIAKLSLVFFSSEQCSNKFCQMFCSSCGGGCPSTANFCHRCGQQLKLSQDSRKDVCYADDDSVARSTSSLQLSSTSSSTVTFAQFKARKEEDRRGYFRCKRPAKRTKVVHQPDNSDAKINVGIMALRDGTLRI